MPALLLTGAPGVGKTTVLEQVVELLAGRRIAGFYTEEVREHGRRRGFRAVPFGGSPRIIADVAFRGPARVGAYGVDVAAIDAVCAETLAPRPAPDLFVVDEVGKMECLSPRFVAAVRRILDAPIPLLGVVALHGGGFIAEVKSRPDVRLLPVTAANRSRLPQELHAGLAPWLG